MPLVSSVKNQSKLPKSSLQLVGGQCLDKVMFCLIKVRSHDPFFKDPIFGSKNWKRRSDGPISRFRFGSENVGGHL